MFRWAMNIWSLPLGVEITVCAYATVLQKQVRVSTQESVWNGNELFAFSIRTSRFTICFRLVNVTVFAVHEEGPLRMRGRFRGTGNLRRNVWESFWFRDTWTPLCWFQSVVILKGVMKGIVGTGESSSERGFGLAASSLLAVTKRNIPRNKRSVFFLTPSMFPRVSAISLQFSAVSCGVAMTTSYHLQWKSKYLFPEARKVKLSWYHAEGKH